MQRNAASAALVIVIGIGSFLGGGCASSEKKALSKTEKARMIVEVANGALLEGDPAGALEQLMRAEELDPELPELHHSKGLAYHAKQEMQTAIAAVRKAVELHPKYAQANNTLGKLLIDAGKIEEAEKYLITAANDPIYREAFKAQTNLGILYYRRGQYKKAATEFDRAVRASPQIACVAYYYKGHIHLKNAEFDGAVKNYDKATQKFCAGFADAHYALGIAYARTKQYDLARKKFVEIKQRYPNTKVADQAMDRLRYLP